MLLFSQRWLCEEQECKFCAVPSLFSPSSYSLVWFDVWGLSVERKIDLWESSQSCYLRIKRKLIQKKHRKPSLWEASAVVNAHLPKVRRIWVMQVVCPDFFTYLFAAFFCLMSCIFGNHIESIKIKQRSKCIVKISSYCLLNKSN